MNLKDTLLQYVLKYFSKTLFIILAFFVWSIVEAQYDIFSIIQLPISIKLILLSFNFPWMLALVMPMAIFISSFLFFKNNWIIMTTSEIYILEQIFSPLLGSWLANFLITTFIIIQGFILKLNLKSHKDDVYEKCIISEK